MTKINTNQKFLSFNQLFFPLNKFHCCLNFRARNRKRLKKFKNLKDVDSLYDYDYSTFSNEESSDEEQAAIVIETDQSKPFSHTVADHSKLISYTDSSSEEEDLHVDVNFDEPIDLAIN